MTDDRAIDHEPWPTRAYILLGLGALAGLLVHLLLGSDQSGNVTRDSLRLGAAAFLVFGGIAFALTLERLRWAWSAAFAAAAGLVVGLVVWSNGDPDAWTSNNGWRFAASLLAVAIAIPLFQAVRDAGSRRLAPSAALDHAWTDAILWGLSCAFLGAVWLLLMLLGGLFGLIGIVSFRQLLMEPWFILTLTGGTLGTIVGLLRDRDSVLGLLHLVARAILSVLAPFLGAGLVLFVVALAFTGLEPLWRETVATTPILLACIAIAILLANAVIGNAAEEEPKARILAWGAMALGAVMFPLAIVAAISMSKRIGQYGFSPDRLWAAIIVAVAVAVSALYVVALVRGRLSWAPLARRYNVMIAAGIGVLALLLALPILDFGAVSARDQVARLQSGRVSPERFDWRAMRFDFGEAGRAALERLARTGSVPLRDLAKRALKMENRWDSLGLDQDVIDIASPVPVTAPIRVRPDEVPLPAALREKILRPRPLDSGICEGRGDCLVFWRPGETTAVVLMDGCARSVVKSAGKVDHDDRCRIWASVLALAGNEWKVLWSNGAPGNAPDPDEPARPEPTPAEAAEMLLRERQAIDAADVRVREVTRRQLFIGDKPVSPPFD